jgi:hypothetical protein
MARKNRDAWQDEEEEETPAVLCWLCSREIGALTQWHHPIPKSRGGREKVAVHPICHRTLHATFSNSDLEKRFSSVDTLLAHDEIAKFVNWLANKPADFDAPTKDRK